jgi:putative hemolysin
MLEGQIIILLVLLVFSAFFSGVETALMSIHAAKVRSALRQKKRGAEALARIKKNPHKLIITILIGNNVVNILAASLATVLFTDLFGSSGIGIATGVMTFMILVFGEITPKTFAVQNAERVSLLIARPIELLSILLTPLVKIFEGISKVMAKILGSKKEKELSEEELKTIVTMGRDEGILSTEAAEMMHNILDFDETTVTEIMTPKCDIDMIDGNKTLKQVIDFVVKTPYSIYPVYDGNRNTIIGILDVDDVLKYAKNNRLGIKVKKVVRKVYFVPESKEIDDLLVEFEGKHIPLAIVVDEYSEVKGLVTVEDILEEIVGDIFDKSKKGKDHIKKINDKVIKANAKLPITEINKELKLGINPGKFDTIAGFIEHKLKKIPRRGEQVKLKHWIIEVDKVTKQGIKSVKIIRK